MRKLSHRRILIIVIVSVLFLISVLACTYQYAKNDRILYQNAKLSGQELNTCSLKYKKDYNIFTNLVQGYELPVKKDLTFNMTYSNICAILSNNKTRIEIYKQKLDDSLTTEEYIGYSNGFMENTIDHQIDPIENKTFGDNIATVSKWSRSKLNRVENDLNNYVSLDIIKENVVYSIFIKSSEPINENDYNYMIEGFKETEIKEEPHVAKTPYVDISSRGWNDETKAFYEKYFNKNASLTWGLFEPDTANIKSYDKVDYYEKYFEYDFPVLLWYNHFQKDYKTTYFNDLLQDTYNHGEVLELTLQTTDVKDDEDNITQENMVYDVLNGEYDAFLTDYADSIKQFGHPILFRLGNEMNGDWCSYSGYNSSKDTKIFIEFYRYVFDFFKEKELDNVIWIWNPNGESKPDFDWNHSLMYYPGDDYVDIVGLTAYNTGNFYAEVGEKWQTFADLYDPIYKDYTKWFNQPMMITEFSSASNGGDKVQWITDMFAKMPYYPKVKMAIWWDDCDYTADNVVARSYLLDESTAIMDAFKKGLSSY